MSNTIKTKNAGEVKVRGGKKIEVAKTGAGLKEGQQVVAFNNNERCQFELSEVAEGKKQHVPAGETIDMHVIDAAIAEKMGKGKIVSVDSEQKKK